MLNLREDKELAGLFKAESDERIERLDQGLLRLESSPGDRTTIEELFRDIHTLKGSAGMVGASEIQTIAHSFEDLLGDAMRDDARPSPAVVARLQRGLDAMRRLVDEVVAGIPSGVDAWAVVALLRGDAPAGVDPADTDDVAPLSVPSFSSDAEPSGDDDHLPDDGPSGAPLPGDAPASDGEHPAMTTELSAPAPEAAPGRGAFQIETIRVDPRKLDVLMTHAGELAVARTRLAMRLAEIDALAALWDEHARDLALRRSMLDDLREVMGREAMQRLRATANHEKLERVYVAAGREKNRTDRIAEEIERLRAGVAEDSAKLDFVATELGDGIRAVRLLPLATILNLFSHMVRDIAREQGKDVALVIEGGEITVDKRILEEIKDPLMHMLRNAIDHGVEAPEERLRIGKPPRATITIRASQSGTGTLIALSDDGRGLDLERIAGIARKRRMYGDDELARMSDGQIGALIFTPGFSTRALVSDLSGRGVGMDVVRTNIEQLKGTITVRSTKGEGTTFIIQLPLRLATSRVLIVSAAGESFAIPVESVQRALLLSAGDIQFAEGRETTLIDGAPVSVVPLAALLELPEPPAAPAAPSARLHCVMLAEGEERFGVIVDALLDEQEIVLKPESTILRRVRNVSGSTILGSGKVCVILNAFDLLKSIQNRTAALPVLQPVVLPPARAVLLVEDSLTTRTQVKRILEGAGYDVVIAVDGMDGLSKLGTRAFDAVISDVEMPNLDGLSMTARIRQQEAYASLPIVLMTSLARDEDKRRGIEVGANAYLTKPAFDQKVLLDTLRRLL